MITIKNLVETINNSPNIKFEDYFKQNIEGYFLEFGVSGGGSILRILELNPNKIIYGFDWFKGLPKPFGPNPVGTFAANKPTHLGSQIILIDGLVEDTLVSWLENNPGTISFVHFDLDLYSGTKFVLDKLVDRFYNGTILAFDEIWGASYCLEHEGQAFIEFFNEHPELTYECIGYMLNDKAGFKLNRKNK